MEHLTKTNVTSGLFAVACLALYFLFPIGELKFELFVGAITFFFVLPILYTKIILKKEYRDIGFGSLAITLRDGFFLASAMIVGGLMSFVVVSLEWGVQKYLSVLSDVIFVHFGAFLFYEFIFTALALFLITFFAWGFVYTRIFTNRVYAYTGALIIYIILLVSFYKSAWIILPLIVPTFFVPQIRDRKNILYLYISIFVTGLILDTLIIKLFA